MKLSIIRGLHHIKSKHRHSAATIGNFDGMHIGHQHLLQALQAKAKALHKSTLVILFEPQPAEYFQHQPLPARLTNLREKIMLLQQQGINYVLILPFNAALARLSAEAFVQQLIVDKLAIEYLLVGDDFQFGHQRQGNYQLLQRMAQQIGFRVERTSSFAIDNTRISSSAIRQALAQADLAKAEQLLGRPYSIQGRVVHGLAMGRKLGFYTANIALKRAVPALHGVFAVRVGGLTKQPLLGVANLGRRPTVGGVKEVLEVHIFNFDQTIYGAHLAIFFCKKLRDEQKFASLDDLSVQVARDVATAKEYFNES